MITLTDCYRCESEYDIDSIENPNITKCEKCKHPVCDKCNICEKCNPSSKDKIDDYFKRKEEHINNIMKNMGLK